MNPRVGIRLRHPTVLSLYCLDGMLFQVVQDTQQLVGHCRSGTGMSDILLAAAGAGLPIKGPVLAYRSPTPARHGAAAPCIPAAVKPVIDLQAPGTLGDCLVRLAYAPPDPQMGLPLARWYTRYTLILSIGLRANQA